MTCLRAIFSFLGGKGRGVLRLLLQGHVLHRIGGEGGWAQSSMRLPSERRKGCLLEYFGKINRSPARRKYLHML